MLDEKMKQYAEMFDEGFPMIPVGWGRSEEEVISIIDECLSKKKDAYELGYAEDDNDIIY